MVTTQSTSSNIVTVSTNNLKMEVKYSECGVGEPLILLHGAHADLHQFDVFRPLLGDGIRAIAYNQRDTPDYPYEGAYSMSDHAVDCAAFIHAMGFDKAHIMGTSYGGAVAMMTAILYPEAVQSLVLASTAPSWSLFEPVASTELVEGDGAESEHYMLGTLLSQDALDNDPNLVAEALGGFCRRPDDMMARRFAALHSHDCRETLSLIEAPTLVLHGTDDPLISSETALWTAKQIHGAQVELVAGGRHGLTLENRQRTADHVRAFIMMHSLGHDMNGH